MYQIIIIANDPHPPKSVSVRERSTAIAVARLLLYDPHILAVDVYDAQGNKIF
jgi:hypothetical protein